MNYVNLITIFVVILCVLYTSLKSLKKSNKTLRRGFSDIRTFVNMVKETEQRVQLTPKSVSGGDSMFIGKIKEDFPEFNLANAKTEIEKAIEYIYSHSESETEEKYPDISISLNTQPQFGKVHKTVISGYEKSYSDACIKFQCAYKVLESGIKRQLRAEIEYVFEFGNSKSLKCPHCGAPVSKLGVKQCEFCGHGIVFDVSEAWRIKKIVI